MRTSVFHNCLSDYRKDCRVQLLERLHAGSPVCESVISIVADYLVPGQSEFIKATLPAEPAAAGWSFSRRGGKLTISKCRSGSDWHWKIGNDALLGDIPKLIKDLRLPLRGSLASELEMVLIAQLTKNKKPC